MTTTPISKEEADEIQFRSLKGIAGRCLDQGEVRRERLGLLESKWGIEALAQAKTPKR